eukprot:7269790-Prymnesium_polylepis.1
MAGSYGLSHRFVLGVEERRRSEEGHDGGSYRPDGNEDVPDALEHAVLAARVRFCAAAHPQVFAKVAMLTAVVHLEVKAIPHLEDAYGDAGDQ